MTPHRSTGLDEAMVLRLERALGRIEPDPLFRRRLRGHVLNRYVAEREGLLAEPRPARQMGRLGRSMLIASLAVTLSVSAAAAAAEESLPGDPLHAVKRQLEEVRMRIAPPSVRVQLAGIALAERVEELERLIGSQAWSMVPVAAAAVLEAREALVALDPAPDALGIGAAARAHEALESALAKAPPTARHGLQRALQVIGHGASSGGERPGKPPKRPAAHGPRQDPGRPAVGPGVRSGVGPAQPKPTQAPNDRSQENDKPSTSADPSPRESGNRGMGHTNSQAD
jgi:hypothetical protein